MINMKLLALALTSSTALLSQGCGSGSDTIAALDAADAAEGGARKYKLSLADFGPDTVRCEGKQVNTGNQGDMVQDAWRKFGSNYDASPIVDPIANAKVVKVQFSDQDGYEIIFLFKENKYQSPNTDYSSTEFNKDTSFSVFVEGDSCKVYPMDIPNYSLEQYRST